MNNEIIAQINSNQPATSLDLSAKENKVKLYNATSNATYALDDLVNNELVITDFATFPYTSTNDDTGEVHQGIQTILFLENGETVATSSSSALQNFKTIISIFGTPSVDNPLTVRPIKVQSTSSKFKYTTLEAVC